MTHGSLFSGIGGFDLAAEWMGWKNLFHCEWNEFGQRVLGHYWPDAECFTDITQTDFTPYRDSIDVLTGGFPCQPYSAAGKRLGTADDRHLWPHMLRAIREVSPRWVVGENVRGLVNWNGGLVFDEVQADLEAEGYEVQPFLIPACAVNAPHRRDRIWFVAYNANAGNEGLQGREKYSDRSGFTSDTYGNGNSPSATCEKTEGKGREGTSGKGARGSWGKRSDRLSGLQGTTSNPNDRQRIESNEELSARWNPTSCGDSEATSDTSRSRWEAFPTQPPVCGGDDGLPSELDGITFPKWRNETIKAYGNAIVPQVVHQIFKAIKEYETTTSGPAD